MFGSYLSFARLSDIPVSLVFFTRLPLPHFDIPGRKLGDAIWAAPIAGLAVALVAWLVTEIAGFFDVPTLATAALAIATTIIVTGCLHEDGLADVADGFGGGKTTERKLEIMHDSRLGTYGAAALLLSVLIRWACIVALVQRDVALAGLIAAHVGSRAIFARLIHDTPLASQSGLAATVGLIATEATWLSLALGIAALLLLGVFGAMVTVLFVAAVTIAFRQLCMRQIGGITGDTLGAAQQLAEIAILLAAAAILA